jgi:hypothetical protein
LEESDEQHEKPEGLEESHMETLVSLSHLAQKLNPTTDSYTRSLSQVEKQLRDINIGVETWLGISETAKSGSPDRETSLRKMLGYAKLAEGWSLAVKTVRVERGYLQNDRECPWENVYEEDPPKPLLKASRDLRIEAAGHVAALLQTLETRAVELIQSVEEADIQLRQFEHQAASVHMKLILQWMCDSCGEVLQSPRERCRCPIIKPPRVEK